MTRVKAPEAMPKQDFEMHMNMRHGDSLGGLEMLELGRCSDYVTLCWQRFHARLHRLRIDLDHDHEQYVPERSRP